MAICRQLWVTVCSTFRKNCMFLKPEVNSTCTRTLDRRWKGLITGHIVLLQKKVLGRIDGHQWLQAVFYNKIIPKPKMFKIDSVLQPLWAVARLSHLDSARPIGEVFYWASSSSPSRSPWVSDGETYSSVRADVVWGEQVAQVSRCLGLLMNWSNTRILTNLLSCKCCAKCLSWQHCFCPLVSLLMKPPSCKARFYCRKSNGGGKCLVFNALLFQFHDCCFKCWMGSYCWRYQVREALVWALPGWDQ